MNIFDITIIVILALCMYACYRKGLVHSIYGLCSVFISLALANQFYPIISKFMRGTTIFEQIKNRIIDSMGLEAHIHEQTVKAQTDLINSLTLPDFVTKSLLSNNNPEVHSLLNVSGIAEYLGGYFANIVINILSFLLVLLIVNIIMRSVSGVLSLFTELPVIKSINKLGGLAIGLAQGTVLIWFGFVIMSFFFLKPNDWEIYQKLNESILALFLYENNPVMKMIFDIFA